MNTTQSIASLQEEMKRTRLDVQHHTGLSPERQEQMFFEGAFVWLGMITNNDQRALQHLPLMREFWGFWKKAWLRIDQDFVETMNRCSMSRKDCLKQYDGMHRITLDNVHLNNTITQAQYHIIRKMVSH